MSDVVEFAAILRARARDREVIEANEYRVALGGFFSALVRALDAGVDVEARDGVLLVRDAAGRETRIAL